MKEVNIISSVVGRDNGSKPIGSTAPSMGAYALKSELIALQSLFNDFLEGDDTDTVINRWKELETFLNGISEDNTLSSILGDYIPIKDYTEILGEKNFTGGLKVNGSPITYNSTDKYWKLEGDLLVTGNVTMYGNDSDFVASTIMDAILYDDSTLGINAQGQLYVKGSVGGATTLGELSNVGSWANSVASQDRIMYQAANSSMWVAKNLSDLEVGGVTGDYLPLTGGRINGQGDNGVTPLLVNSNIINYVGITMLCNNTESIVVGYWNSLKGLRLENTRNGLNNGISVQDDGSLVFYHHDGGSNFVKYPLLHSGNYSSYALPLSGGVLTSSANKVLELDTTGQVEVGMRFSMSSVAKGWVGYIPSDGTILYNNASKATLGIKDDGTIHFNNNTVWHSGNDGSGSGLDADLLDGLDSSAFIRNYGLITNANTGNALLGGMFRFDSTLTGLPTGVGAYGTMLTVRGGNYDTLWQMYGNWGNDSLFYRRGNLSGLSNNAWRQIAFTDSNVASATKLQTARTIWGQSFDGTGNIEGNIHSTTESLTMYTNSKEILSFSTNGGYLSLGYGTLANGFTTYLHGYNINLRYGASGTDGLILKSSGNVGIGTASPLQKLHVMGNIAVNDNLLFRSGALGNITIPLSATSSIISWLANDGNKLGYVGYYSDHFIICNYKDSVECSGFSFYNNGDIVAFDNCNLLVNGAIRARDSFRGNYSDSSKQYLSLHSNGNAYINTPSEIYLQASTTVQGNLLATGGITMYSDIRKKTKLQDVELSLSQIANAPLIEHYYNSDDKRTTHVGSIAQYWAGLNDWFCKLDNEGYYTMEIQNAALASAISIARELDRYENKTDKKIKQLKKRISQLEDEIERLKNNIN